VTTTTRRATGLRYSASTKALSLQALEVSSILEITLLRALSRARPTEELRSDQTMHHWVPAS